MPFPIIIKPEFPNVPIAIGVPPLLRPAGAVFAVAAAVALTADAAGIFGTFGAPLWGIFDQSGNPVIVSDTVIDFAFRKEWKISDAPQEQGAFMSYNKVELPFDGPITFAKSGPDYQRTAFLQSIEQAVASLELFSLVMPERIYPSCNVTRYSFRRSQRQGVQLILVDVWVEEVRVTGTTQFTNPTTASPSGADPQNGGTVQALPPAQNPGTAGQQSVAPAGGLT